MLIVQECRDCGHVWKYDTNDSFDSQDSRYCPKCDCTTFTFLRAEDDD